MWWNGYWPMWGIGPIFFMIFMIGCMALMMFMMRGHFQTKGRAINILKERYARGEINEREFEERRHFLEA